MRIAQPFCVNRLGPFSETWVGTITQNAKGAGEIIESRLTCWLGAPPSRVTLAEMVSCVSRVDDIETGTLNALGDSRESVNGISEL